MNPVSDIIIDQVIDDFENGKIDYEQAVEQFTEEQPALISFLLSDAEGVLTDDERDFQLYLALVIWQSFMNQQAEISEVSLDIISEAEEKNWALLDKAPSAPSQNRLDVFFDNYPEEELLAFVEDAVSGEVEEDEDGESFQFTQEGQEPMFIALKTVIDVLSPLTKD